MLHWRLELSKIDLSKPKTKLSTLKGDKKSYHQWKLTLISNFLDKFMKASEVVFESSSLHSSLGNRTVALIGTTEQTWKQRKQIKKSRDIKYDKICQLVLCSNFLKWEMCFWLTILQSPYTESLTFYSQSSSGYSPHPHRVPREFLEMTQYKISGCEVHVI